MIDALDKLEQLAQKARQHEDVDLEVNPGPILARIKAGQKKPPPALAWFTIASCLASAAFLMLLTEIMDTMNDPLVYAVVSFELF